MNFSMYQRMVIDVLNMDKYVFLLIFSIFVITNPVSITLSQYQVWREFSQQSEVCTTSKLRVYHTQSRRYRSVWHLLYNNWGDQHCPKDVNHFLRFIEELGSVRLESVNEVPTGHNTNPPVYLKIPS